MLFGALWAPAFRCAAPHCSTALAMKLLECSRHQPWSGSKGEQVCTVGGALSVLSWNVLAPSTAEAKRHDERGMTHDCGWERSHGRATPCSKARKMEKTGLRHSSLSLAGGE